MKESSVIEGVCFVDESISYNLATTVVQAMVQAGPLGLASLWKTQNLLSVPSHASGSTTTILRVLQFKVPTFKQ